MRGWIDFAYQTIGGCPMKEFKKNKFECYSPALRQFISERGIDYDNEYETTWEREERIAFMKRTGKIFCPEDVVSLTRRCWVYENLDIDTEKAELLSSLLTEWTERGKK